MLINPPVVFMAARAERHQRTMMMSSHLERPPRRHSNAARELKGVQAYAYYKIPPLVQVLPRDGFRKSRSCEVDGSVESVGGTQIGNRNIKHESVVMMENY